MRSGCVGATWIEGRARSLISSPINPHNLHNAGVQWPNTWATFEEAYGVYEMHMGGSLNGIGFVLTPGDPFVGIDIDHCID